MIAPGHNAFDCRWQPLEAPFFPAEEGLTTDNTLEGWAKVKEIRLPRERPIPLKVYEPVQTLGKRGRQGLVEPRVEPLEVLCQVVANEDFVEPQGVTLPHTIASFGPAEMHAPDLECVREESLFRLAVVGVLRG